MHYSNNKTIEVIFGIFLFAEKLWIYKHAHRRYMNKGASNNINPTRTQRVNILHLLLIH